MFNDYLIDPSQGEENILIIGEEDDSVITFSPSIVTSLTERCINQCGYCSYSSQDSLSVPYSTIKEGKRAREKGLRAIHYVAGEAPDHFPEIRATLDLWGFNSYGDYLYNVCELGFLEGLIPVLEIGSLSKETLETVSEIIGGVKVMLDSVNSKVYNQVYPNSPGKAY
jgi:2-iminoacetate synthase ThiH